MTFPRYPAYKDSGVTWLGEVPEHWEVKPLRYLSTIRKGRLPAETYPSPAVNGDLPYLSMEYLRGDTDSPNFVPESQNLLLADSGDILLLWDGSNAGEFLRAKQGVVSSTVAHIESINVDKEFLFFICKAIEKEIKDQTTGMGIPHVSGDGLRSYSIPCPDKAEQTAIAAFLDLETAKIDDLIAEQRSFTALLKEKRQAVISHAVTKGLNPTAAMKDSGVAWLGEVPGHWEVTPLKRDLQFLTSGSRGWADNYADEGALFIRIGNLTRDHIHLDLSDIQRVNVQEGAEGERTRVKPGDVLFSITAYLGSIAVVPEDIETAYVSQHVALARLNCSMFTPTWVAYVAKSSVGKTFLETQGYGGTKVQLSLDDVASILMTVPPLDEQAEIIAFLNHQTTQIDTLILETEKTITLLQERRSALISAAVTGKMDVRVGN